MKKFFILFTTSFFLVAFFLFFKTHISFASGVIDPSNIGNTDSQIVSGDSVINFKCTNCNVSVTDSALSGFAWSSGFGWINLNPSNAGVVNNGQGVLSGFAWGENTGWINFKPANGGVLIDVNNGIFSGFAWGENTGWIDFNCVPGEYCLETSWRPAGGGGEPTPGGGGGAFSYPACSDGIDNDGDGYIDYPEDLGCESSNSDSEILTACALPNAENFNNQANIHDDEICIFEPILGCTDPSSLNFNPFAEIENNSCLYAGCTNSSAVNYNQDADFNDGSCVFENLVVSPKSGCTDPLAENYNPSAEGEDGSCTYAQIPIVGCTDPLAENYNQEASIDNGQCVFLPVINGSTEEVFTFNPGRANPSRFLTFALLSLGLLILGKGGTFARFLISPIRLVNSVPAILGLKRKKRPWGTVYDSITKQPLDPVYVELKDIEGKTISTSITDIDGRFGFLAPVGQYKITSGKKDYIFPSEKMAGKKKDALYENLYFGDVFKKDNDEDIVARNIPMDPINFNWNEFEKSKNKKLLKFYSKADYYIAKMADTMFTVGFLFSLLAMYLSPTRFNIIIVCIYVIILCLSFFGITPEKPGFIFEKKSKQPLSFGVVRIFSSLLNKEIAHCVIGKTGRYFALVGNGKYFIKVEKKVSEEEYKEIYISDEFDVKKGYINNSFTV